MLYSVSHTLLANLFNIVSTCMQTDVFNNGKLNWKNHLNKKKRQILYFLKKLGGKGMKKIVKKSDEFYEHPAKFWIMSAKIQNNFK